MSHVIRTEKYIQSIVTARKLTVVVVERPVVMYTLSMLCMHALANKHNQKLYHMKEADTHVFASKIVCLYTDYNGTCPFILPHKR